MAKTPIRSDLAWSTRERITVRGKDLPGEIPGTLNPGDMAFLELTGRVPNERESRLFNAMVVTLVEHGITPSALAARLAYLGAPQDLTLNATGAIGALACELGLDWRCVKGLGVMARASGLVGHILEESRQPMAAEVWHRIEDEASAHLRT